MSVIIEISTSVPTMNDLSPFSIVTWAGIVFEFPLPYIIELISNELPVDVAIAPT